MSELLRIITKRFKSAPVDSFLMLADEMPFQLRRNVLCIRYYCKMRGQLIDLAFNYALPATLPIHL